MQKCVIILPYFGQFNNYFTLFLKSCEANPEYNWIIITDDHTAYRYPDNVRVVYMSFEETKNIFKRKIDSDIALETPYKLCDFKPAYGYVFEEYIKDYEYWGHCDCDLLFGNLSRILGPLLDKGYDKLFPSGHLTLYKNNPVNNTRFMSQYHGRYLYREFLKKSEICWFDEDWKSDNIHTLFLESEASVYCNMLAFNPSGNYAFFRQRNYIPEAHSYQEESYRKALYVWDHGNVFRIYEDRATNTLHKDEYLYIHLQHRQMAVGKGAAEAEILQIVPNIFKPLDSVPSTVQEYRKICKEPISAYKYILNRQKKRIQRKIEQFMK